MTLINCTCVADLVDGELVITLIDPACPFHKEN